MTTSSPDQTGEAPPPAPRWVKVFAGIIVVILGMLVVLKLVGGGGHGPGRHTGSADTGQAHQKSH